jgi:hypothetical protein
LTRTPADEIEGSTEFIAGCGATRVFVGSTMSQHIAPTRHRTDAVRNAAVHPNLSPIQGVSEAVSAAPIWLPVFMTPETEPDELPAMSAVTDQNEL